MTATATKPAPAKAAPTADDYRRPTNATGLQRLAQPLLPQIAAALPGALAKNAERMVRALLTECQKTPALLDCSPASLLGGVMQVAQLGLELGGPTGHAYLIPFKGQASLVIGYKGFITLAHRSGQVRRITPRVVRQGDTFEIEYGTEHRLRHVPKFPPDGPAFGYYATVELTNGGTDFEYMSRAQVEAHRDRFALSKRGGPWATDFDQMALKTCVRFLAKRLPLSPEWITAAGIDEATERGEPERLSAAVVIDGEEIDEAGTADNLRARMARAKGEPGDPESDPYTSGEIPEGGAN